MTLQAPSVSVIVVTFNAREFVERCLRAVLEQDYSNLEIVVVDNHSHDGTPEFIRQRFPGVRLVCSEANVGFGAGNNLGVAVARGGVFAFLNPDAVPEPTWLSRLVGGMREHSHQFATSKITLLSDRDLLNSGGNLIHYLGLSFCRGLRAQRSRYDSPELVSGASGAAFAITRDLFVQLGGFDGTFFMYHDDVDLSLRALLAGERCLYVPGAVVAHEYTLLLPPRKWAWIEAHRYAVLLKTFKLRTLMLLLPALLAMDLVTFAYLATRGPAFAFAKLQSYGWLARNLTTLRAARRRAQVVRKYSDRQILSVLTDEIPYEQLAPAWLAHLAHGVLDPWFRGYRRLSLSVVRW
jgi:GT2 family glycosyltransferase